MNGILKIVMIVTGFVLVIGVAGWVYTAPYVGNEDFRVRPV